MRERCNTCNIVDDGDRFNYCVKFKNVNLFDTQPKVDLTYAFSPGYGKAIIKQSEKVWKVATVANSYLLL